jgi:hypothetical protein
MKKEMLRGLFARLQSAPPTVHVGAPDPRSQSSGAAVLLSKQEILDMADGAVSR